MNEQITTGLSRSSPMQSPDLVRTRQARPSARAHLMPYPETASLYLGGFGRRTVLSRDEEVELARQVEKGERAMLRALLKSPAALRELGAVGQELERGSLHPRDLLRGAEDGEEPDGEHAAQRLAAVLRRAGAFGHAAEAGARPEPHALRSVVAQLQRLRLLRRVMDRIVRVLYEAQAEAEQAAIERVLARADNGRRLADIAKGQFVQANIGLVVMFAKRHAGQGLPLHDLIQEGNIGLMRAVDKFDHRRGIRFSTYAAWWVKQQMTRAVLDQAKTIRVPVHLAEARQKVRRLRRAFEQQYGREPSEAELGEQSGLWPEKLRAVLALGPEPLSLDLPAGADGDARLGDFVADRTTPAPDEEIANARMRTQTRALLEQLTPREQDILRRRFGLDDAPEETLAQIGASLSLSRERVRQIEAGALRKLRAASKSEQLDTYFAA